MLSGLLRRPAGAATTLLSLRKKWSDASGLLRRPAGAATRPIQLSTIAGTYEPLCERLRLRRSCEVHNSPFSALYSITTAFSGSASDPGLLVAAEALARYQ